MKNFQYFSKKGFKCFQLKGGILNYLNHIRERIVCGKGCFVFDNRISLKHKLQQGSFSVGAMNASVS